MKNREKFWILTALSISLSLIATAITCLVLHRRREELGDPFDEGAYY